MKTRRHHYVWRYYLRSWSKNEQIWCNRENKIFPTNLMNIGQERDFYRLKDLTLDEVDFIKLIILSNQTGMLEKLNHGWVELFTTIFKIRNTVNSLGVSDKEFEEKIDEQIINLGESVHCEIEANAVKYLEGIIVNNTDFFKNEDHVIGFIHYLCVQYFRTKNIKKSVVDAVGGLGLLDIDKTWNILSHIFSTTLGYSIYRERTLWSAIILENNTNTLFLTGDQPIINTYAAFGNEIVEDDELEFYYPVSPSKALLLTKKIEHQGLTSKSVTEEEVTYFNNAIVYMASEQIYASSKKQLSDVQ